MLRGRLIRAAPRGCFPEASRKLRVLSGRFPQELPGGRCSHHSLYNTNAKRICRRGFSRRASSRRGSLRRASSRRASSRRASSRRASLRRVSSRRASSRRASSTGGDPPPTEFLPGAHPRCNLQRLSVEIRSNYFRSVSVAIAGSMAYTVQISAGPDDGKDCNFSA